MEEIIRSYQDLAVWKQVRVLAKEVYVATRRFPKEELYGLTSQVRRASVSVVSNIAEGCGRGTWKSSIVFFHYSRGSLYEVEAQLMIAHDLGYLSEQDLRNLLAQVTKSKQLLNGLIRYFKSKATANAQPSAPSSAANNE